MLKDKLIVLLSFSIFSLAALAFPSIPIQQKNEILYDSLPDEIKKSGKLVAVNAGFHPPFIISADPLTGASIDLSKALGEIIGIEIENKTVNGFSGMLSGIQSRRYQLSISPTGDYPDRHATSEFIDYVKEFVAFAVIKGNPLQINSLADACGKRIAVLAGGSAEKVIHQQSKRCVEQTKTAVAVQAYPDQPGAILSVRSGRADAVFNSVAPLSYFVQVSNGQLELAGVGQENGFGDIYQGVLLAKNSPLTPIIFAAFEQLFNNGTYAAIMKRWHIERNMLSAPGLNLGGMK